MVVTFMTEITGLYATVGDQDGEKMDTLDSQENQCLLVEQIVPHYLVQDVKTMGKMSCLFVDNVESFLMLCIPLELITFNKYQITLNP